MYTHRQGDGRNEFAGFGFSRDFRAATLCSSMKPGDDPEFFRFPAPEGRSRESTIVLKADGHFEHDGVAVEHRKLEQAMHTWVSRHPDDGRFILTNGYDWTYFTVEDAPFFVRHLLPAEDEARASGAHDGASDDTPVTLVLSDGSSEMLDPARVAVGADGALYAWVKASAPGGPFEAKFTRHAQTSLARFLHAATGEAPEAGDALLLNHARFVPKPRDISPKK